MKNNFDFTKIELVKKQAEKITRIGKYNLVLKPPSKEKEFKAFMFRTLNIIEMIRLSNRVNGSLESINEYTTEISKLIQDLNGDDDDFYDLLKNLCYTDKGQKAYNMGSMLDPAFFIAVIRAYANWLASYVFEPHAQAMAVIDPKRLIFAFETLKGINQVKFLFRDKVAWLFSQLMEFKKEL